MSELKVPSQWTHLGTQNLRGTVMVVGSPDTGKSTLARYLYQTQRQRGVVTAYLDTDVGQSTLGLPTTMTVAAGASPEDGSFPPKAGRATYFVGANTPRGHMLPAVVGAFRLQQQALTKGAECIVVDTTGLVEPEHGGVALKRWKMELLLPSVVIGLRRGQELEPILWPLRRDSRIQVQELPVCPYAVKRSREDRVNSRRRKLARYFHSSQTHSLQLAKMAVYGIGQLAPGALFAFQDGAGFALGLGVVERVNRSDGTAVVCTPLPSWEGASSIRIGAARWDMARGREC